MLPGVHARRPMSNPADMATRERSLAEAASQRARQARLDAANAAFQDTADTLSRQAEEEERAARSHLEAAREYERLASERDPGAGAVVVDEAASPGIGGQAQS